MLDESNENLGLAEGRLRLATAQNYSNRLSEFQARSPAGALALALMTMVLACRYELTIRNRPSTMLS